MALIAELKRTISKFCWLALLIIIIVAALSPYLTGLWWSQAYKNMIDAANTMHQNIQVTGKLKLGYDRSVATTTLTIQPGLFIAKAKDNPKPQIITLVHHITHVPIFVKEKKLQLAAINTEVSGDLPTWLQKAYDNEPLQIQSVISLDKTVTSSLSINPIHHVIDYNGYSSVNLHEIAIDIQHDLQLSKRVVAQAVIPQINYTEANKSLETNGITLTVNLHNQQNTWFGGYAYEMDKLYLTENGNPVFRLANLQLQQSIDLAKYDMATIKHELKLAQLNLLEQKIGPINNRVIASNVNPVALERLQSTKLPIEQFNLYKTMETAAAALKYRAVIDTSHEMEVQDSTLQLQANIEVGGQENESDLINVSSLLDSLYAGIKAKIPKQLFYDILYFIAENAINNNQELLKIYTGTTNMPAATANQPIDVRKAQIEKMVFDKAGYLLKNKVIKEYDDYFYLDLSISQGTFYSRLNPFKIFTF